MGEKEGGRGVRNDSHEQCTHMDMQVTGALKEAMEVTKRKLNETRCEVECLTNTLNRVRENSKSL